MCPLRLLASRWRAIPAAAGAPFQGYLMTVAPHRARAESDVPHQRSPISFLEPMTAGQVVSPLCPWGR